MSMLITTIEAIEITGIPRSKFVAFMRYRGVRPIDFGRGPRNGLRWLKEDVIKAVFCELRRVGGSHGSSN